VELEQLSYTEKPSLLPLFDAIYELLLASPHHESRSLYFVMMKKEACSKMKYASNECQSMPQMNVYTV
jgi:hypothetical protein